MTNRISRVVALFLLLLGLLGPAPAQEPSPSPDEESSTFRLEQGQITVLDKFKRPYVVPRGTAYIGVKLALEAEGMSPFVGEHEVLTAQGVDYEVNPEADWVQFPLDQNGSAKVDFVAFSDPARNPVIYQLAFLRKEGGKLTAVRLSDSIWRAGDPEKLGSKKLSTPGHRAPNQPWEWALLAGFTLAGLALTYFLFGRSLFERMLRVKRLEVTSALGYSNLMVIGGLFVVLACALGLFFFPKILWDKQYMVYLVVGGGSLAALGAGYGAGLVLTKA